MSEDVKEEIKITLPKSISKATRKSPKNLLIFSKPKTGKTTLISQLPNCLILDFEEGTDYIDALKIKIDNISHLKKVIKAILEEGRPYDFIAVDTITALENMCVPLAEQLYSKSLMGKNWYTKGKLEYGNILNMPSGAGYPWLRQAFEHVISLINIAARNVILVGHVKDVLLEKGGAEFSALELDLTGKIKRITASNSDAIGYLYRKGNKNILSFKTTDDISCGARPEHLRNKEIVISETDEKGNIITHWEQVYLEDVLLSK